MKRLVFTIAIGDLYTQMGKITHPFMQAYAKRIGADFYVADTVMASKTTPHWEKFILYDLLDIYDRIIYVDTDALILPDCPDLFDVVPAHMIGAFNEGRFFPRPYTTYYNTGIMVVSACHREVFIKPDLQNGNIHTFFEQNTLNNRFLSNSCQMFELSHKFNKMDFIQADGHIIHKAGNTNALAELREMASSVMGQTTA